MYTYRICRWVIFSDFAVVREKVSMEAVGNLVLYLEILMFFMGVKYGYSSPYTLTDQSTAVKKGQKGDLHVLRPHLMPCVPVRLAGTTS